MHPHLQEMVFGAVQESPGTWLYRAYCLFAAAKRLDPFELPARDDEPITFDLEYRMLLGLALEVLLKGIIIRQRLESGQTPPLPKECLTHSLEMLATRSECVSVVNLSEDEIQILRRLTLYVEWAGRYPIPKKSNQLFVRAYSNKEHKAELDLWDRLYQVLGANHWVMKGGPLRMGGYKLQGKPTN